MNSEKYDDAHYRRNLACYSAMGLLKGLYDLGEIPQHQIADCEKVINSYAKAQKEMDDASKEG